MRGWSLRSRECHAAESVSLCHHTQTTKMLSFRLLEAIETAALRVLNAFCDHHPLEVFLTPLGLLPTVDPEDPAWRDRMGHMAALLTATTPLDTVQMLAQCMRALYNLQALRHASVTNLSQQLSDVHGTLRERHTHLHILSLAYLEQDGHLAQAHQRIAGLEARVVQLEIEHGNRLQTIFELQDQRDGLQGLIADLEAERMAHLQALAQMEEQLELMDLDLGAANNLIAALQQPMEVDQQGQDEVQVDPEEIQCISGME